MVETLECTASTTEADTDSVFEGVNDARDAVGEAAMQLIEGPYTADDFRARLHIPDECDVQVVERSADGDVTLQLTICDRATTPGTRSIGGDKTLTMHWGVHEPFVVLGGQAMALSALPEALLQQDRLLNWSALQGMTF